MKVRWRKSCSPNIKNMRKKFEEERNEGEKAGENRVNELNLRLSKAGRMEDMMRAMEDKAFQKQLFEEFGL